MTEAAEFTDFVNDNEIAKKKCPECKKVAPPWMTTFADMATLLMALFSLMSVSYTHLTLPTTPYV